MGMNNIGLPIQNTPDNFQRENRRKKTEINGTRNLAGKKTV